MAIVYGTLFFIGTQHSSSRLITHELGPVVKVLMRDTFKNMLLLRSGSSLGKKRLTDASQAMC